MLAVTHPSPTRWPFYLASALVFAALVAYPFWGSAARIQECADAIEKHGPMPPLEAHPTSLYDGMNGCRVYQEQLKASRQAR